jgi:hypothetical protein
VELETSDIAALKTFIESAKQAVMKFDELMQIYLSLGVVAGNVVPSEYVRDAAGS